jgi:flagellar assembly protein FliH
MSSIIKAEVLSANYLPILEPHCSTSGFGSASTRQVVSRHLDAMDIMRRARQQAAALLEQARLEAECLREQAKAEGYAAGVKEGREQGLSEGTEEGLAAGWNSGLDKAQELVRRAEGVLAEVEAERRKAFANLEHEVVELAFTIAEKVVQRHIMREDSYLVEVLTSALQQLDTTGKVVARVHVQQLEQVIRDKRLHQLVDSLEVLPDETFDVGDWILETEAGMIDGRLATRFADVNAALESVVSA